MPESLFGVAPLQQLLVDSNKFTGSFPSFKALCSSALSFFTLYENRLTGSLPTEGLRGLSHLAALHLWNNRFEGSLPEDVGI
eukprot:4408784-Amphidinium_carterae.1